MKKVNLVIVVLVTLILCGCEETRFYMKSVKYKDAQITEKIKIAVIPENWYWTGVSSFLPRALITEFLDLGFMVIERSQLEKIFQEIKLDLSGIVKEKAEKVVDLGVLDKASIKKVGEMLGVDALLLTYIIPTYKDEIDKATFRLVDVETSKVLFSITLINCKGTYEPVSTETMIKVISSNIKQLLQGHDKILTEKEFGQYTISIQPLKKE